MGNSEKIELIAELKDLVSDKMDGITQSINQFEKSLKNADNVTKGSGGSFSFLKQFVGANLITSGISAAGSAITSFVKGGIEGYKNFEQFGVALTTMFHGNRVEAEQLSQDLVQFAKTTPYELTEVQNATKQLIAFGSTSREVKNELRMLGDVGSGIGSSLGDLSYLYGTVRTQGRAMTMDINQFANRGIPIWKELEKITGKNGLELRKFVEEGKVGFPMIQKVFENLTKEGGQFYNMMEAQSKTLAGQISNMDDAWAQFQIHTMESKSGLLKDLTSWATKFIDTLDKGVVLANKAEKAVEEGTKQEKEYNAKYGISNTNKEKIGYFQKLASDEFKNEQILDLYSRRFNVGSYDKPVYSSTDYQKFLELNLNQEPKSGAELYQNKAFLQKEISQLQTSESLALLRHLGEADDYHKLVLQAKGMLKGSEDAIANWKKGIFDSAKIGNPTGGDTGVLDDPKKLDTLAKANRPTQMYITIKELVHEINVQPTNFKESILEATKIVSQALTSSVNDLSVLENNK